MANINDFKARLAGGGARANQFKVTMPFPGYSTVGGETQQMAFLCTTAQLPGMTISETPIPFRGRTLYIAGDREFEPWTVTILNDTDFLVRNGLEMHRYVVCVFPPNSNALEGTVKQKSEETRVRKRKVKIKGKSYENQRARESE